MFDLQECRLNTKRESPLKKNSIGSKNNVDRIEKRVISFLNIALGGNESSTNLWSQMNSFSNKLFGCPLALRNPDSISTGYLLQSIQFNFGIKLSLPLSALY